MVKSAAKDPKRSSPAGYVFDSFALLGWLTDEPGANTVQAILEKAERKLAQIYVSWMNVAEVYYITARRSLDPDKHLTARTVVETIESLPVQIQVVSKSEALAAASLKAGYPISLADACAAALAKTHLARIVTGDPEFKPLEENQIVEMLWLPMKPPRRRS